MKNYFILLLAAFVFAGCENHEEEVERLKVENQSLSKKLNDKDSTLSIFEESFTTIQQNLALISEREKSISMSQGDLKEGEDMREDITRDIQAINNLLQENKNTISNLNKQLSKYGSETAGMKKLIGQLNTDIETLTAANFTIEILNEMLDSAEFRNEIQADMLQMQENELNRAYYAVGTFKELKENGVVEKDGSVIGIGGTKQLKDDFNKDYFAQVNTQTASVIPLNAADVKLITTHPSDSYVIEGDETKVLKIVKPNDFWSATRYAVIMID
ncbi:MAG: hypothetical protein LC664_15315 [Flavobacteriales bacterium]|nr:hypothetical protein [Flavobacteriales bacterium]